VLPRVLPIEERVYAGRIGSRVLFAPSGSTTRGSVTLAGRPQPGTRTWRGRRRRANGALVEGVMTGSRDNARRKLRRRTKKASKQGCAELEWRWEGEADVLGEGAACRYGVSRAAGPP
jgi:hypothetical protein